MFSVYALKSLKDGKYYFGQTENVIKRVIEHNKGRVKSTKFRRPLVLVGYKTFTIRNEARWFEYNIKNHSDKKKKFIADLENFKTYASGQTASVVSTKGGHRPGGPLARREVN